MYKIKGKLGIPFKKINYSLLINDEIFKIEEKYFFEKGLIVLKSNKFKIDEIVKIKIPFYNGTLYSLGTVVSPDIFGIPDNLNVILLNRISISFIKENLDIKSKFKEHNLKIINSNEIFGDNLYRVEALIIDDKTVFL